MGMIAKVGAAIQHLFGRGSEAAQPGPFVDPSIFLGQGKKLACRLIAWRLPEEQANRRRQKLREETRKKRGCEPSAERLAWCDWTIR